MCPQWYHFFRADKQLSQACVLTDHTVSVKLKRCVGFISCHCGLYLWQFDHTVFSVFSCAGGNAAKEACPAGTYNAQTSQSDLASCQVCSNVMVNSTSGRALNRLWQSSNTLMAEICICCRPVALGNHTESIVIFVEILGYCHFEREI